MAKNKNGFTPPKGKPTSSARETHPLKDTFAVTDLGTEEQIAAKYTKDGADQVSENVRIRHVNRTLNKGEELDEDGNIIKD